MHSHNNVISTTQLDDIISDDPDSVTILDARNFSDYSKGHIPSAINLDLFAFHWNDTTQEGIHNFQQQTTKLFSFAGCTKNKTIIIYDDKSGMLAARGVWMLLYMSYYNVYMLDGGFTQWCKESRRSDAAMYEFEPTNVYPDFDSSVIVGYEYVLNNLNKLVIIDARSVNEYNGTVIRAARGGHIPGAINIEWSQNIDDDTGMFKNNKQLAELYKDISRDSEIVTYCQGAYRAANSFLALKKAGFKNVRVYLGSWGEWGNLSNVPVERNFKSNNNNM